MDQNSKSLPGQKTILKKTKATSPLKWAKIRRISINFGVAYWFFGGFGGAQHLIFKFKKYFQKCVKLNANGTYMPRG